MWWRITGNWWAPVSSGVLSGAIGIAALIWPSKTVEVLALMFGIYAFVSGAIWLAFSGLAADLSERWWPFAVNGIVGIGVGVLTFAEPRVMAVALVSVLGAWALLRGALEIVAALRFHQIIFNAWLLGLSGALAVLFGIWVLAQPNAAATTLALLFGVYAVLAGAAQIWLGIWLRSLKQAVSGEHTPAGAGTLRSAVP